MTHVATPSMEEISPLMHFGRASAEEISPATDFKGALLGKVLPLLPSWWARMDEVCPLAPDGRASERKFPSPMDVAWASMSVRPSSILCGDRVVGVGSG